LNTNSTHSKSGVEYSIFNVKTSYHYIVATL
jgi:hypothetical protein